VLKLKDKIKLFKHRCVSSLGYNMYERAYEFLRNAVANGMNTDERRSGLIKIMGEESIGFWALLDQILFFEDLIDEITTAISTTSATSM
jgi:NIMA (never in mitosis gene a)-related kinase 1/4/5